MLSTTRRCPAASLLSCDLSNQERSAAMLRTPAAAASERSWRTAPRRPRTTAARRRAPSGAGGRNDRHALGAQPAVLDLGAMHSENRSGDAGGGDQWGPPDQATRPASQLIGPAAAILREGRATRAAEAATAGLARADPRVPSETANRSSIAPRDGAKRTGTPTFRLRVGWPGKHFSADVAGARTAPAPGPRTGAAWGYPWPPRPPHHHLVGPMATARPGGGVRPGLAAAGLTS